MSIIDFLKRDLFHRASDRQRAAQITRMGKQRAAKLFLNERLANGDSLSLIKFCWARDWPELLQEIDSLNEVADAEATLVQFLKEQREKGLRGEE